MAKKRSSAKTKKKSKAAEIVRYVLIVLVLLAVLALLFQCTRKQDDFSVIFNGKQIVSDAEMKLPYETELRFDVKYTTEANGYDVEIVTNATRDNDFEFTIDGTLYKFSDEGKYTLDFKSYFDFTKKDDYFTLTLHDDTTMQGILEAVYSKSDVVVPESVDLREKCYFAILVTSYDGKTQIRIPFKIASLSIVLDHNSIIF